MSKDIENAETSSINSRENFEIDNKNEGKTSPADFETAVAACGFGTFNICLLLITIPGLASTVFEASTMSYILPSAECDLHLSLVDKGMLNAITYAGMILSAVPWGYIADTMGRKRVLVYGLLSEGVFVICGALSQNVVQLVVCKFLGGFVTTGPFAVIMSYVSEFHGQKHRSRVMMVIGMMKSSALLILPVLAYAILPYHFTFYIGGLKFQSWQIFVICTAVPSLLSGSVLTLFPESPKFLMSQGRNDEALKVFQTMYALNTRNNRETYPITTLYDEAPEKSARNATKTVSKKTFSAKRQEISTSLHEGLRQLKPMFRSPYLKLSLLVYAMNMGLLMGQNTIRLWLPQLFASIEEYKTKDLGASSMCAILSYNVNKTKLISMDEVVQDCSVIITSKSYTNNIIVAATSLMGGLVASFIINKIGNKNLLSICLGLSCSLGSSLYWSTTSLSTLIISSIFVTISGISGTTVISSSVAIFPTAMRTMVIVMIMTFGRLGSLLGNILFPFFIALGCIPPFMLVGSVLFCAFIVSLFLPNTSRTALK